MPFCSAGKTWDGTDCVDRTAPVCPSGQSWNGSKCVPIVCDPSQTWDGSKCVTTLPTIVVTPGSSSGGGGSGGVFLIAMAAVALFVATLSIKTGEPTRVRNPYF